MWCWMTTTPFWPGLWLPTFLRAARFWGDVAAETTAILSVVKSLLAEIGLEMTDIVRCDVHMKTLRDMPEMNAAYAAFFPGPKFPARTTTQSAALFGGSRVEITCIARRR